MNTLQLIVDYLDDKISEEELKDTFEKNASDTYQHFHVTSINKNNEIQAYIQQILQRLNVEQSKRARFNTQSLSFFELINELNVIVPKSNKLKILQKTITSLDKTITHLLRALSFSLLFIGLTSPAILFHLDILLDLLRYPLLIPGFGLLFTLGLGVYSVQQSFKQKSNASGGVNLAMDQVFLIASTLLSTAAYAVAMAGCVSITTNPLAAFLYISATIVDLIKEASHLIKLVFIDKVNQNYTGNNLGEAQVHLRTEYDYKKTRNNLIINAVAAALVVGLSIAYCLIPGSIFVTAGILGGMGIILLAKYCLLKFNEKQNLKAMHQAFDVLETEWAQKHPTAEATHQNTPELGLENDSLADHSLDVLLCESDPIITPRSSSDNFDMLSLEEPREDSRSSSYNSSFAFFESHRRDKGTAQAQLPVSEYARELATPAI